MTTRTILICGAGIAGLTLAHWLARHGFKPTIVERAPAAPAGGQAVDVRGVAVEVLNRMDLLQAARNLRLQLKGTSILDGHGKEILRSDRLPLPGGQFARNDLEILRDDLAAILIEKIRDDVELTYGDSITALREDIAGVDVTFEKQPPRRFDVVVGADGLHSTVRHMAFGDSRRYLLPFDYLLAFFTAPNRLGLRDWEVAYRDGGEGCRVYTAKNNSELRVGFGLATAPDDEQPRDIDAQKRLLADRFDRFKWQVPELLEAMWAAPDLYVTPVTQVRMSHYTKGRVALIGDAGYCPSPFSGQGTSLALVGAYVLAHELARSPSSHAAAFAGYEARMNEYIKMNQLLARLVMSESIVSERPAESPVLKALATAKNGIVVEGLS